MVENINDQQASLQVPGEIKNSSRRNSMQPKSSYKGESFDDELLDNGSNRERRQTCDSRGKASSARMNKKEEESL